MCAAPQAKVEPLKAEAPAYAAWLRTQGSRLFTAESAVEKHADPQTHADAKSFDRELWKLKASLNELEANGLMANKFAPDVRAPKFKGELQELISSAELVAKYASYGREVWGVDPTPLIDRSNYLLKGVHQRLQSNQIAPDELKNLNKNIIDAIVEEIVLNPKVKIDKR